MHRLAPLLLLGLILAPQAVFSQSFRKPIIDSLSSLRVNELQINSADITPNCPFRWSITKQVLRGGKQEDVDVIIVDNGRLRMTIVPTRGMGVLSVNMGDVRLGWDSPIKEVVHPRHINLSSRGGLGWVEGFNEWMVRCGLENNGQPGQDKFINNVGDEATMDLTLHGKIANIPASSVEVVVDQQPPYRIRIRGRVDERVFFGPKLELTTEISTEPGTSEIRIADVVANRGDAPQEFQMLYHVNQGRTILEAGAKFVAPAERVTPFNDNAAKAIKEYNTYRGPTPGFIEQVYAYRLYGDDNGRTMVLLHNKSADRGMSMSWALKELPYLTLWKNTAGANDGYVTGIEPGTNFPYSRRLERAAGRVPKLAPRAEYAMTVDYAILIGSDEVKRTTARIDAIVAGRKTTVDEKPDPPKE